MICAKKKCGFQAAGWVPYGNALLPLCAYHMNDLISAGLDTRDIRLFRHLKYQVIDNKVRIPVII